MLAHATQITPDGRSSPAAADSGWDDRVLHPGRRRRRARRTRPPAERPRTTCSPGWPADVHHPTGAAGQLRHGRFHPLPRLGRRDGRARGRRQRRRRRGRRRLHPAGRRAAPQRTGRRPAADAARCRELEPIVLCGQGPAPAAADPAAMADRGLRPVPGRGVAAAAMPGSTAAWLTLLRDHGTMDLGVRAVLCRALRRDRGAGAAADRAPPSVGSPDCSAVTGRAPPRSTCPAARRPAVGSLLRNPTLARTYRRLIAAAGGPRPGGRHRRRAGEPGPPDSSPSAIDAFCSHRAGRRVRRPLPGSAHRRPTWPAWRPEYEAPVSAEFARLDGVQDRAVGSGSGAAAATADARRHRPRAGHRRVRAHGDRGRPSSPSPTARPGTATIRTSRWPPCCPPNTRRSGGSWSATQASIDLRPGRPDGRTPRLPTGSTPCPVRTPARAATRRSARSGVTRGDTCHIDVVDRWGDMVSATPSGGWLHSSPVIPSSASHSAPGCR